VTRTLEPMAVPTGPAVLALLPALADALDGRGPAWLPVPAGDGRETARLTSALDAGGPVDDATALVVATSGSTGTPKGALLSGDALRASGWGAQRHLGGPGSWLLALPAHHVAGMQVLVRSVLAGTEPVVVPPGAAPAELEAALARMPSGRRYGSLVPTQLVSALDHPGARAALATLDALLLGGAATPPALLARAVDAGIAVVRTYGMSETCGGCIYDGVPLEGVTVRIEDGRVLLGGPTLAAGYRGRPEHPAWAEPGWFRTDDAGVLADGVLTVLGRLDDAISTGGLTVLPQLVEAALGTHPGVHECVVLGVPDERWGQRVVAVVVPTSEPPSLAELRDHVARTLDRSAAPRELHLRTGLPLRGPGKVDRRSLLAELTRPRG
jgi:O-succinylbenzoic acid--CoA ligase